MTPPSEPRQLVDHLFRHEAGRITTVLTRLLGFDRLELAEDIVQDVLLYVWERRQELSIT